MRNLRKILKNRLPASGRIAALGIGSELRSDDAAGTLIAVELKKKLAGSKRKPAVKIFFGGTAPENLTGEIKKFKPVHLIIIDTADLGKRPGSPFLLTPDDVGAGVSFSTHKMPAKVLIDYLVRSTGCRVTIIGIQPKSVDFGKPVSRAVKEAVKKAARALAGAIR